MLRVRFLLAAVATGSIALTPPPAVAGIPPGRLAIGDSVMLGAEDELVARGFRVNATVSRQFRDVVPLLEQMKSAGRLRRKVIIHLGNNGILIDAADCNRISEIAGPNRTVSLVNLKIPRWYRSVQNRRLAACAQRRANTVLVNWFFFSRDHRFWFAADGLHLTPTGQARYAAFVATKTAWSGGDFASVDSSRWSARAAEGTRLESV
jgi:lysophospholipase L1-like esterase